MTHCCRMRGNRRGAAIDDCPGELRRRCRAGTNVTGSMVDCRLTALRDGQTLDSENGNA